MTPYDFALLAQEAYSAPPSIGVASSASRAIVRETAAGLVVAFPGTNDLKCVLADGDMRTVTVDGIGRIHEGFWDAWQAIAPAVEKVIAGRPVTLVGHSLGAAIALLAAMTPSLYPQAVYGFEPPRVSPDATIATRLSAIPVYLTRNGNDLVTQVPFGWHHAGVITPIGKAIRPWDNIEDHALVRVVAALPTAAAAPGTSAVSPAAAVAPHA